MDKLRDIAHRFRTGEPARVASDTRKALALLSRMEAEARHSGPPVPEDDNVLVLEVQPAGEA